MVSKITIKNDTGEVLRGTKVLAEDGTDLGNSLAITRITTDMDVDDGIVRAEIHLGLVKTEIKPGSVQWLTKHPVTGKYAPIAHIHFADKSWATFNDDGTVTKHPPPARQVDMSTGVSRARLSPSATSPASE